MDTFRSLSSGIWEGKFLTAATPGYWTLIAPLNAWVILMEWLMLWCGSLTLLAGMTTSLLITDFLNVVVLSLDYIQNYPCRNAAWISVSLHNFLISAVLISTLESYVWHCICLFRSTVHFAVLLLRRRLQTQYKFSSARIITVYCELSNCNTYHIGDWDHQINYDYCNRTCHLDI